MSLIICSVFSLSARSSSKIVDGFAVAQSVTSRYCNAKRIRT